MSVKLLTEHHLEVLSLKGGCTGTFKSTLVNMPHCWKSHVAAHVLGAVAQLKEPQTGDQGLLVSLSLTAVGVTVVSLSKTLYQQLSTVQPKKTENCPDIMGKC